MATERISTANEFKGIYILYYALVAGQVLIALVISYLMMGNEISFSWKMDNPFYLIAPILLISMFFIVQKFTVGWYFFPEHISYLSIETFLEKLEKAVIYLFIGMGRNMLTLFGAISLLIIYLKKRSMVRKEIA